MMTAPLPPGYVAIAPDDTLIEGDEQYDRIRKEWIKVKSWELGRKPLRGFSYRRRGTAPA
jgi:hypothetical protein